MELLIKLPTRERANQAIKVIDSMIHFSTHKKMVRYLLTLDEDDPELKQLLAGIKSFSMFGYKVDYIIGKSENKIHAVNRDLDKVTDWDVLVLTSDDMIPVQNGWDVILRALFEHNGLDTVVYTPDGYTPLNTLPILGKEYYNRFGYVYNPIYKSFFCDNEFHIIAESLKKQITIPKTLFKHEHFCNNSQIKNDVLYQKNQKWWAEDEATFNARKVEGFGYGFFNPNSNNQ
jgi:hypothetical protein